MNELLWYLSRATGLAAIVLLTSVFVLGAVSSAGGRALPASTTSLLVGLHRNLALGTVAFLALHILSAVVETYVDIGWIAAIVPFTSGYERAWLGLGTIAVDLFAAVAITSLLRPRLGHRAWRAVHMIAYALLPLALVHGIALGSQEPSVLRAVPIACAAFAAAALAWRLGPARANDALARSRRSPVGTEVHR